MFTCCFLHICSSCGGGHAHPAYPHSPILQLDSNKMRHKIREVIFDEKKSLAAAADGYNKLAEPSGQIVSTDAIIQTKTKVFEKVIALRRLKEEEMCREMQQHWTLLKAQSLKLGTISNTSFYRSASFMNLSHQLASLEQQQSRRTDSRSAGDCSASLSLGLPDLRDHTSYHPTLTIRPNLPPGACLPLGPETPGSRVHRSVSSALLTSPASPEPALLVSAQSAASELS
ncbi:uncharacterized protein LOC122882668 [Siniperca chuatsi]|uniref:uncharacterized protein LOC122882668 n=1 Tax=Siniperca chuatsi TaxID=119488 RepID=UPI001CE135D8|nr:uncharacterized protein LOC122882668 [Siniperca chuatsi]